MRARFATFSRDQWARLGSRPSRPLTDADFVAPQAIDPYVSLTEVRDVYLPVARLLDLYVAAARGLQRAFADLLALNDTGERAVPYIIGVAGGVAVGKSTTARLLQALLARWPEHPDVELVATDGFLYPNAILEERGLVARKGFPESYDHRRLTRFLADIKSGRAEVTAPVYSHQIYDVVSDAGQVFRRPDVLIVEGLNVLQSAGTRHLLVSDLVDFAVYVDADEADIERWYIERFLVLRAAAVGDAGSFYHRFAGLTDEQAAGLAREVWRGINGVNLRDHIEPTRPRAHLILEKGADHTVRRLRLRRP